MWSQQTGNGEGIWSCVIPLRRSWVSRGEFFHHPWRHIIVVLVQLDALCTGTLHWSPPLLTKQRNSVQPSVVFFWCSNQVWKTIFGLRSRGWPAAYTFWNYIYASRLLGLVVLRSKCYLGHFTEAIPYWLYLHHVAHSMEIFQSDSRTGWAHKLYEIRADPLSKIVKFLINPHTAFLTEKY